MWNDDIKEYTIKVVITLCTICVLAICIKYFGIIVGGIHKVISICMPFIYGACISYLILPLCKKIYNSKLGMKSWSLSIALSELLLVTVIILAVCVIIPQGVDSLASIVRQLPETYENTREKLTVYISRNKDLAFYLDSIGEELSEVIKNRIAPVIESFIENIVEGTLSIGITLGNLIFGVLISIFILANKNNFSAFMKKALYALLGSKTYNIFISEIIVANKMFSGFFYGKTVDSLIVGIACMIILTIIDMPYATIVSVIVCITNMIPIVGPFIGAIPSTIIIFSESPIQSVYFVVFILILQQIDGHIIGPKCIGNATGLSTFWVLFSIIFFGNLWGIAGMLIGVPLMAVILDVVNKVLNRQYKKRQQIESLDKSE